LASLVPLIRRTGTAVVVVGIDNAKQTDWWRHTGADSARGIAFAPPMAPDAVPALQRRDRS
jgi:EAL domain-containing protein (putative c-di-GMP-specific phosphodiesterase class I)